MNDLPVISVTELVTAFKEVVETALPPCIVEGEVSNCRKSPTGHWYLTLKDEQSEISATIWRSAAQRLRFEPKDGMKVLATGSLQVYATKGTCQFNIAKLMLQGVGELEMAFRQLRDKLAAEGLFEASRKRAIPKIPRRIALVTSPSGAAVRDMIQVITRRWPPANIVIVPVRVQGEGAAEEIARALKNVHRIPDVDVVITGRGGGSLEDLWCFNTEVVARAIAACKLPVISAVGHEIDVSIADLVADRRALTPSEAGEFVVPSASDLRDTLRHTADRLKSALQNRAERIRLRLAAIESRGVFQRPASLVEQRRQDCDMLCERAARAMRLMVERRKQAIGAVAASLQALSPLQVLARGYSLTQKPNGQVIRTTDQVHVGDLMVTRLHSGVINAIVESVEPSDAGHAG
ncbi:MAG: exodeoxyribonuclease VII large subunit [Planctomycetaceae bacterium]|nr:exodeoxyribonuclease VII large subunit [Planctomycetaceae bacterium]